jgi:hypothetical protein
LQRLGINPDGVQPERHRKNFFRTATAIIGDISRLFAMTCRRPCPPRRCPVCILAIIVSILQRSACIVPPITPTPCFLHHDCFSLLPLALCSGATFQCTSSPTSSSASSRSLPPPCLKPHRLQPLPSRSSSLLQSSTLLLLLSHAPSSQTETPYRLHIPAVHLQPLFPLHFPAAYANGAAPRMCYLPEVAAASLLDPGQSAAKGQCQCAGEDMRVGLAPHPATVDVVVQQPYGEDVESCRPSMHTLDDACDEDAAVIAASVHL